MTPNGDPDSTPQGRPPKALPPQCVRLEVQTESVCAASARGTCLRGRIALMTDDDLKALFAALQRENADMRAENAAAHADTRRHFEVLTEGTRHEILVVAESVAAVNEKLDREAGDIRDEMRRGFTETQAMIKFSHADIDRCMRTLEDAVADLLSRVERLEGSTH